MTQFGSVARVEPHETATPVRDTRVELETNAYMLAHRVTAIAIVIVRYREVERKLNLVAEESLREVRVQVNARGGASARRIPLSKKIRKRT